MLLLEATLEGVLPEGKGLSVPFAIQGSAWPREVLTEYLWNGEMNNLHCNYL